MAALVAAGVLWTNFLAYNDSSIAPQARFRELAAIGSRYAGQGPAFYNLYDTFAVYFLRHVSPAVPQTWGARGLAGRAAATDRSSRVDNLPWDPNDLSQAYLQRFHLLILGRSPMLARPPANYRLLSRRAASTTSGSASPPLRSSTTSPISGGVEPLPPPTLLSAAPRSDGGAARSRAAGLCHRPPVPSFYPSSAAHPARGRRRPPTAPAPPACSRSPSSPGPSSGRSRVPAAGNYRVWLYGSFSRPVTVWVGKRDVGSVSREISSPGQVLAAGDGAPERRRSTGTDHASSRVRDRPREHRGRLRRHGRTARAGDAGSPPARNRSVHVIAPQPGRRHSAASGSSGSRSSADERWICAPLRRVIDLQHELLGAGQ